MNIGKRKRKTEDEFIPEWDKECNLEGIECSNCFLFDDKKKWCTMYQEEYLEHLQSGKKIRLD